MTERKPPPTGPLEYDLCDHWNVISDRRCHNYWYEEIVLEEDVNVDGGPMFGHYHPGTWRFCKMHARIFQRDRA